MKVEFLASSIGKNSHLQFLSSFIIDECLAMDAGAIGLLSPLDRQQRIRHVVLSHSHMDHIASLPMFLDNVYSARDSGPTIHASAQVQECLRRDLFNHRLWPDLVELSGGEGRFVKFSTLVAGKAVQLGAIRLTPIPLDHVVPCFAYLLEDRQTAIAYISDTALAPKIWDSIQDVQNLKAVFLEASFPNSMQWLADESKHLTPRDFGDAVQQLALEVPVIAIHLKPNYYEPIVEELQALNLPQIEIGEPGKTYVF